jgi:molybdopterin/thiamine biosynthesis adenylyltransferase
MSDIFSRQRGLVHQEKVESLKVTFANEASIPQALKHSMKQIAQQLGVKDFPNTSGGSEFTLSWIHDAIDFEWKHDASKIFVSYGQEGVFLDGTPCQKSAHPMFEPSLATISACLIWSEIFRRANCYTPVDVPKVSVSVNVRVNEPSMKGSINHLDFQLEGIDSHINIRPVNDGTGHKRVLMRLDDETPLVQELLKKLQVSGGDENIHPKFPIMRFTLPEPKTPPSGHLTVVGAGGLGTWALHSIVNGLKNSDFNDIQLLVFDKDMEVERHNLNRQVIFSESDIGRPKIEAAKDWLNRNLPDAKISIAYELHDGLLQPPQPSLETSSSEGFTLDDLLSDSEDIILRQYKVLKDDEIRHQLEITDAILGCLDAMRPRVLADLIAARKNQPYVNGGITGLFAQYTEFSNTNLVETYGPSVAHDQVVYSCQEDGEVPLSSLAITNAFIGSLQAISALQHLTGQNISSIGSVNWDARYNEVYCNLSGDIVSRKDGVQQLEDALWHQEETNSSPQSPSKPEAIE